MLKRLLTKFLPLLVGAMVIALGITQFTTTQATTTFSYAVTDLGTLGGNESVAYDINDSGQAVGHSTVNSGSRTNAVLWSNGTLTDLRQVISIPYNYAVAINNAGQVVCNIELGSHISGRIPYIWQNGNVTNIFQSNQSGYATAINNVGQVVGWDVSQSAFIWQNGSTTYLNSLGDNTSNNNDRASDINNKGQIVGYASTSNGNQLHAVLWENNTVTDLGTLPGGSNSEALGINNPSTVVGWSETSSGIKHAVSWQNNQITDLGTLDSNGTKATDINNRGTIVGYSFTINDYSNEVPLLAFVSRNGRMVDLNNLLATNSGWELNAAYAINNQGQIVGSGQKDGQTRAFLLTPVRVTR